MPAARHVMRAACEGQRKVVEELVGRGADVNASDNCRGREGKGGRGGVLYSIGDVPWGQRSSEDQGRRSHTGRSVAIFYRPFTGIVLCPGASGVP